MSQRTPFPNGSPSVPQGSPPARSLILERESPTKRLDINRRPSHLADMLSEPSRPKQRRNSKPSASPTLLRSARRSSYEDVKPSRSRRLANLLGRRKRWQRFAIFALLLFGVYYLVFKSTISKSRKGSDVFRKASGHSRKKTKPLHVRASSPIRASVPASVVLQSRSEHEVKDGLLEVDMGSKVHPLYQLIRDAREEWDEKVASQSNTLEAAVEEYRRRNKGMMPPKGFDKWWTYVVDNNVLLPDEYDQINRDLHPYRALSPRQLLSRIEEASRLHDTYTIRVKSGSMRTSVTFDTSEAEIDGARMRVDGQVDLLRPVAKYIPNMSAVYSVHDVSERTVSWDHRAELYDHVDDGEYLDDEEELDMSLRGWASACAPSTKIRSYASGLSDPPPSHSFISFHRGAMDLCAHPEQIPMHGLLAGKNPHHQALVPLFCLSKTDLHSDVLGVPTEQWAGYIPDVPWEEKTKDRLLWRGSNTGSDFTTSTPWRDSHRIRMIRMAMEDEGSREMLPLPKKANGKGSALKLGDGIWEMSKVIGNQQYLDFNFTGSAIQCSVDDGTCDELEQSFHFVDRMTHDDALHFKYVVDVDGNAWSARFQRLLMSGSLIFKATITPEWWTERIQPWVHYVPMKMDYTDLYDILAFFQGDLNGENGEPHLAKQIATEGKEWAERHWRKEDMTAYVFRLYLEWARLMAPNRKDADFVLDKSKVESVEREV